MKIAQTLQYLRRNERFGYYQDYCRSHDSQGPSIVGQYNTSDEAKQVAGDLSEYFGLNDQTYSSLPEALAKRKQALEDRGLLIMVSGIVKGNTHRPLDIEEFRGFALSDNHAPLIFINGRDSEAAKNFTLMHELAHIALGESGVSEYDPNNYSSHAIENWCDRVAAEILVPASSLHRTYAPTATIEENMEKLANRYKVSTLVILRRMKDLDFISEPNYKHRYQAERERLLKFLDSNSQKKRGGNYYKVKPSTVSKRFLYALTISTLAGKTLYRDALQLSNIKKIDTFNTLAKQIIESY